MHRPATSILLLLLSACAAPHGEKMSFAELYGSRPSPPPEDETPAPRPRPRTGGARPAPTTEQLRVALEGFSARSSRFRSQSPPGSPMPREQADNWTAAEALVGEWLKRAPRETPAEEVEFARTLLEVELSEDARIYGDFPAEMVDAVLSRLDRLEVRLARLKWGRGRKAVALRFTWPLEPVTITSVFGSRLHPITRERRDHLGVDLAAKRGQSVLSAAPGVVLRAGWNGSHGLLVELQHDKGARTRYSHLSRVLVAPGEVVEQGEVLGLAGKTGLATGVHLHFELWRQGQPVDPLDELEPLEEEEESWDPSVALRAGRSPPG